MRIRCFENVILEPFSLERKMSSADTYPSTDLGKKAQKISTNTYASIL